MYRSVCTGILTEIAGSNLCFEKVLVDVRSIEFDLNFPVVLDSHQHVSQSMWILFQNAVFRFVYRFDEVKNFINTRTSIQNSFAQKKKRGFIEIENIKDEVARLYDEFLSFE